jgi:hypothetical protein
MEDLWIVFFYQIQNKDLPKSGNVKFQTMQSQEKVKVKKMLKSRNSIAKLKP